MESTAKSPSQLGKLYIAATPIGHLSDVSLRLKDILVKVEEVLAEDTRHCRKLFDFLAISPKVSAYHEHNEAQRCDALIDRMKAGAELALICDAGTPLINDPGYRIVAACHAQGVPVVPIPGPCAAVTALSVCGLPTDRFLYEGFLSAKGSARRKRLQALASETATLVIYESSHRILACLQDMSEVLGGERRITLCRELTKRHETIVQRSLGEMVSWVAEDANQQKGEFVLVVEGASKQQEAEADIRRTMRVLLQELPLKRAAAACAKLHDVDKREAYQLGLSLKDSEV